jgi:hypothetical protein
MIQVQQREYAQGIIQMPYWKGSLLVLHDDGKRERHYRGHISARESNLHPAGRQE